MSLSGKIGERIRTSTTVHNLKEAIWDIFVTMVCLLHGSCPALFEMQY